MAPAEGRLVRIATARDEIELAIWRDVLAKEGITVYVRKRDPLVVMGVAPTPPYSLDLYVPASDARRARWLLGQPQAR
jgi:hypothetical protein